MSNLVENNNIFAEVKEIIQKARKTAYKQINFIMVEAYWNIGKKIVNEEQKGKSRAEYGKALIKELSKKLTEEFGKGFSERNLYSMKKFCQAFPILQTVSAKLSWSHYTYTKMKTDRQTFDSRRVNANIYKTNRL